MENLRIYTAGIKKCFRLFGVILPVAICLTDANIVLAQDSDAGASVFEEIVVTARKREESLEDIPVALTAFTGDDIAGLNMGDLFDVGKNVPNLFIGNFGNGNQNHTSVFMRGVGTRTILLRLIQQWDYIWTTFTWAVKSVRT